MCHARPRRAQGRCQPNPQPLTPNPQVVRAWTFITILFTALLLTAGFVHVWQLPPRLDYEGVLWLDTLIFYIKFGPAGPGPVIEVAAIIASIVLALLMRGRRLASHLTWIAVTALLLSTATYWLFIWPVNRELLTWSFDNLPQNWTDFRDQWEYAHAARAGLMFVALATQVAAAIGSPPAPAASSSAR
jgi:hypothetical protein